MSLHVVSLISLVAVLINSENNWFLAEQLHVSHAFAFWKATQFSLAKESVLESSPETQRYDPVKIKPIASKVELNTHCDSTLSLMIFVGVESMRISGRIDLDFLIALIFRCYFRHQQSSLYWVISEGVVSEIGRKWKRKMEVYVLCFLSGELK